MNERITNILSFLRPLLISTGYIDFSVAPHLFIGGGGATLGAFLIGGLANKLPMLGMIGFGIISLFVIGSVIGSVSFYILAKYEPVLLLVLLSLVPVV